MEVDLVYKNKIGERLTRRLAKALKDGEITEQEMSTIASYILENINHAKDNAELIVFVEELSKKWPIFSQILVVEQREINEENKNQAIDQAECLMKENKIDEAIKVVENVTHDR